MFEIKNVSAQPLDISADELKERFVRGDKSRNEEGNGLGLSIADNLCRAMHGRMEIHIGGCIGGAGCLTHGERNKAEVDKYGKEAYEKTITDAISMLK